MGKETYTGQTRHGSSSQLRACTLLHLDLSCARWAAAHRALLKVHRVGFQRGLFKLLLPLKEAILGNFLLHPLSSTTFAP